MTSSHLLTDSIKNEECSSELQKVVIRLSSYPSISTVNYTYPRWSPPIMNCLGILTFCPLFRSGKHQENLPQTPLYSHVASKTLTRPTATQKLLLTSLPQQATDQLIQNWPVMSTWQCWSALSVHDIGQLCQSTHVHDQLIKNSRPTAWTWTQPSMSNWKWLYTSTKNWHMTGKLKVSQLNS